MEPKLFLHRARLCAIDPPEVAPAAAASLLGLCLTAAFGALTVAALTGRIPPPLEPIWIAPLRGLLPRLLVALVGGGNGVMSLLVAIGYGRKAAGLLGFRLGWIGVRESEGPCRLVEEGFGVWGLRLELERGSDPAADTALTQRLLGPSTPEVIFRLDEASAGSVSHMFDPGEVLRLRWCNLPSLSGGPWLLEIRSVREETRTLPATGEEQELRAA